MPTELIGALIGKFEKSELYTFLTGLTVSLAVLIGYVDSNVFSDDMPMVFFRFAFLFIFSTACVYAVYTLLIFVSFFIFQRTISGNNRIGKWCISKYSKQKYLYLPAYAQLQEGRHILTLIAVGLLLMLPWIIPMTQKFVISSWFLILYKGTIIFLLFLSLRTLFYEHVYDLCVREKKLLVTNDQKQYIEWLNSQGAASSNPATSANNEASL